MLLPLNQCMAVTQQIHILLMCFAFVNERDQHVMRNRNYMLQVADDLSPLRVLALFSAITAEDCILLDVADRPEYLIMTHIPVPPVCIRPSVDMDSGQGSNEDDLTVRLRVGPQHCWTSDTHVQALHGDTTVRLLCPPPNPCLPLSFGSLLQSKQTSVPA